jgi:2'-5' RNA ligase
MATSAARSAPPGGPAPWRCFIALWPDPAAAAALYTLADRLHRQTPGSRCVARDDLHLTLAFIGALSPEIARRIACLLTQHEPAPFRWRIDHLGRFERARVAWAAGPDDARLSALAAGVRRLLDAEAVTYDRRAFVPHVTLLRALPPTAFLPADARHAAIDPPIDWRVGAPRLLRSAGGHYRDVAERPR